MKQTERDAIEELAQLLDGELSADAATAPVQRLATLVATVRETETVERPTPAERAALRNRLVADIQAGEVSTVDRVRDAVWDRTARFRNSARVAVASAVASGMLGSVGVAAAAQHALPGDALYGIKRATETVRLTLASGLREEAQVQFALAEERLDELREGADRLSIDETVDTLARMDQASLAASDALIQAVTDGADPRILEQVVTHTARQRAGLIEVYDGLPLAARPFADASLEVLRRIEIDVAATIGPCGVCEQIASGASIDSVTPGDGVDSRVCDCLDPAGPPPPREPAVTVPSSPLDPPSDGSDLDEPAVPSGSDADEPDVIPPLPGPLDDVGDAVDDAIGDVGDAVDDVIGEADDTTTSVPTTDPDLPTEDGLDPVQDTLDQTVEDVGGLLEPTP